MKYEPVPTTTLVTATLATTIAALFAARHHGAGASPNLDAHVLQDVVLCFGVMVVGGCLLDGVRNPDSIGRGLLWGAGGLAATYGIDKALTQGRR